MGRVVGGAVGLGGVHLWRAFGARGPGALRL
jgi:hypothetical protein